jgi:hypothetical protein
LSDEVLRLAPEVDLLDHLTVEDVGLPLVARIFGQAGGKLQRARHVVSIYLRSGLVQLIHMSGGTEHVLRDWEARPVLAEDGNWTANQSDQSEYVLRLTQEGYDAFVRDSEGFFERLFGH